MQKYLKKWYLEGGNYLPDFISYKKYMVGTDEDEDVFYGVCLTPNTDYIKIEIY